MWWGRCYEEAGSPLYWPWIQLIRGYVQTKDAQTLLSQMGPSATYIGELIPELRSKLPGLGPSPALEPEQGRFRLFDSITTFLKVGSNTQPLVLILEDPHWADRSSLLLLEFFGADIAASPIMVVAAYRDVEVSRHHPLSRAIGSLIRELSYSRLQLGGLTLGEVGRIVRAALADSPPLDLVEAISKRTEGNPFFVAEVVDLLSQEGIEEGVAWDLNIPEGIRDVIGRRLDKLSQECDQVLTVASVVGTEFSLDQLKGSVGDLSG